MKIKSIVCKTLLTSAILGNSLNVLAHDLTFKVAVIKNVKGSKDILSGKFDKGINSLMQNNAAEQPYELDMGLCVAYLKTNDFKNSERTCTAAINSIEKMKGSSKEIAYHKSISYSNRGISRYLDNNVSGAINDLAKAMLIDANHITKNNLKLITLRTSSDEMNSTIGFSE